MHVAGHKQRPPLHPQEKWFLGIVLIQLIFMPWAFGTMHVWSQVTSLALSAVGMVLALWPRVYEGDYAISFGAQKPEGGNLKPEGFGINSGLRSQVSSFRLNPLPRLLKFPLFWLGLVLLGYIALQAANPSWVWERNATQWWLRRVTDIPWLPTSIDTPFERFDLWRQFIIYGSVWLTTCALWVGITRRRTLHILLGVLVANAAILGLVGFVHRASGAGEVLWLKAFRDAVPFASFIYQGHAGAYFSLLSFAALGLAVWHFFEGRKRMARSTPSALWLIVALLLVFTVIFTRSRGAIISLSVFGVAAIIAFVFLRLMTSTQSTIPAIVPAMVALGMMGTLGLVIWQVDFSEVSQRFEQLAKLKANDSSVVSRRLAREGASEMLADHWVRGVGAGGFRFLYPEYIKNKPSIYHGGQYFWEHAHNDWLQIPIELGAAGSLLLLMGGGYLLWGFWRGRGWAHPVALMIALGAGAVLAHAVMDFPFQCPAILVTWWALLVIGLRWVELDRG